MGTWGVRLAAAAVVLVAALWVVVPGDSLAARVAASAAIALALVAAPVLYLALRRGERAASVWAAATVLAGGVLFLLLHSLFVGD
ncbi:MAG TPA: hypothetical protein VFL60_03670 [Gaiellaceae bacterium]|nr:hypothetical protein [Gaiellaceae bacterium]